MKVNNEGTNTQKMLQHNQAKEKVYADSLSRKLVNVAGEIGGSNIDIRESTILNCLNYEKDMLVRLLGCDVVSSLSAPIQCVESDVDLQILIKIKFNEKVDIASISFVPPSSESSSREVSCPRVVKLFVNQNDIDFANDLDTVPAAASIEVPFDESNSFVTTLSGSKFTRVASLQIFIQDNYGTEFTTLGKILLQGFFTPTYHAQYK